MMFTTKNLVLALSLAASSSYATTCIVDFVPPADLQNVGRFNFMKKKRLREAEKKFYIEKIKTASCYRASLISTECPVDRDKDTLEIYNAALAACDKELEKTVRAKFSNRARADQELAVYKAARTGCNEESNDEQDKLLCYLDLAGQQITELNPASESARDATLH
jgi:hypothetical protein